MLIIFAGDRNQGLKLPWTAATAGRVSNRQTREDHVS